ncbi:hypothetical protein E1B28_010391 [Marasmius oreades]|uniref:Uncharacterized protein n=1 Tax=Marasmius oreades TaxID=181124 RepID=A0A9P7RX49_9AGAR|nr:uncharacterized protein E1B28_010391 [Marasmius oreades]KAG7091349.1 hypothetical protein E1B28_010391 [Marasmius oreades]
MQLTLQHTSNSPSLPLVLSTPSGFPGYIQEVEVNASCAALPARLRCLRIWQSPYWEGLYVHACHRHREVGYRPSWRGVATHKHVWQYLHPKFDLKLQPEYGEADIAVDNVQEGFIVSEVKWKSRLAITIPRAKIRSYCFPSHPIRAQVKNKNAP